MNRPHPTPRRRARGLLAAVVIGGAGTGWLGTPDASAQVIRDRAAPALRVPRLLPRESDLARVKVRPRIRALADDLDATEFATREAAMDTLLQGAAAIGELCVLLEGDDLSVEQRTRLLLVVQNRLRNAPRGAVGIRMQWRGGRDGNPGAVEIADLLPGLPAERVLELGDQVIQVDGQPLRASSDLVVLVQSKAPGESVELLVNRVRRDERGDLIIDDAGKVQYDELELTLELGDANDLEDPTGTLAPSGAVEQTRAREAIAAAVRYARPPRFVAIAEGRASGLVPITPDTPATDTEATAQRLVERLEVELALFKEAELEISPARRTRWADELSWLTQQAADDRRSEPERRFLRAMLDRYTQLVPVEERP
ncbi:MAG: PDZ domain-containing protein [Phycisphaerales bacterium]|nr:PDZ domain-containing protein [Phycisphaerae bacterium]NNF42069.1 PDZ domain-containing protein [Phycisphaerales bacterium]NNM25779.1 PDZ domain-containing protein [Phycisphaerales bacterium]